MALGNFMSTFQHPGIAPTAYSALAVANYFLAKAWSLGESITPMKLQKLVYYAHGWHLVLRNEPLIREDIQAWKHGPVIEPLYQEFKRFGNRPITEMATVLNQELDLEPVLFNAEQMNDLGPILERVWKVYGSKPATTLSAWTHRSGTPWALTTDNGQRIQPGKVIGNDLIKKCFHENRG